VTSEQSGPRYAYDGSELERLRAEADQREALIAALTDALLERVDDTSDEESSLQTERQAAADQRRGYAELVKRVTAKVRTTVPEHARVAVISKGDEELLNLGTREGWHLPRTRTGLYAGFHPADGEEALAQLEQVRAQGARFLVVPVTATWWLDHYEAFRAFLEERCELIAADDQSCRIYRIAEPVDAQPLGPERSPPSVGDLEVRQAAPQVSSWLAAVLPPEAAVVALGAASTELTLPGREMCALTAYNAEQPESLRQILSGLDAAIATGARFVVLVQTSHRRSEAAVRPLRLAVSERGRLIARQGLAELFEVRAPQLEASPSESSQDDPGRSYAQT
jgi:hypothetical protein